MTTAQITTEATPPGALQAKPKPNQNALLMLFRKYHTWLGVVVAGFVVTVSATGIYLNHKNFFNSFFVEAKHDDDQLDAMKSEKAEKAEKPKPERPAEGKLRVDEIAQLPVSLAQALEVVSGRLDASHVERVEIRVDKGRPIYKVKATDGSEAIVDARTGDLEMKSDRKKPGNDSPREPKDGDHVKPDKTKGAAAPDDHAELAGMAPAAKPFNWGKAIKDLHTGKIGGEAGKLLVDGVAVILIVLTLTGLYLWLIPILRKRRTARRQAEKLASLTTS
jgi:hypothetical protein